MEIYSTAEKVLEPYTGLVSRDELLLTVYG